MSHRAAWTAMVEGAAKGRKYRENRTEVDGKVFASKKEAERYSELLLLEKMGQIERLECQVRWTLVPRQEEERAVTYTADFQYFDKEGHLHVEDAKGYRTQQYVIRRKLMRWVHGIKIKEI